jgi:hypothetical protein
MHCAVHVDVRCMVSPFSFLLTEYLHLIINIMKRINYNQTIATQKKKERKVFCVFFFRYDIDTI